VSTCSCANRRAGQTNTFTSSKIYCRSPKRSMLMASLRTISSVPSRKFNPSKWFLSFSAWSRIDDGLQANPLVVYSSASHICLCKRGPTIALAEVDCDFRKPRRYLTIDRRQIFRHTSQIWTFYQLQFGCVFFPINYVLSRKWR
jgi:hypothetical protein